MIFITGDTHGDFERFKKFKKPFLKHRDYIIVCGDFGFIWNGSKEEQKILDKFKKLRCTCLFIEGTHDNLDLIKGYPEKDMFGGKVREINENLFYLERGQVFEIEGRKIFALGGGQSYDADDRIIGETWWPEEMPSIEELKTAEQNLYDNKYNVDLIITHQNPHADFIVETNEVPKENNLVAFLLKVSKNIKYKHWYFGCEHTDRTISSKITAVFEKIIAVDDDL